MQPQMQKLIQELKPDAVAPTIDLYLRPADNLFPLKVGDELFGTAPDDEPNDKIQFRFNVALSEPQVSRQSRCSKCSIR